MFLLCRSPLGTGVCRVKAAFHGKPLSVVARNGLLAPRRGRERPIGPKRALGAEICIGPQDKIITAGSCFAQHISRALRARGYNWLNAEPAPPFLPKDAAQQFNYGIFSFRTGNIYTPAMLLQWLRLAFDAGDVPDEILATRRAVF